MRMGAHQARALVEARLSRPAQDSLEASIVLEAWGGLSGASRFDLGEAVMELPPREPAVGRPDEPVPSNQAGTDPGDGFGLVMALLAIVIWMLPLASAFGAVTLARAWQAALPVTISVQWLLVRRYLAGPGGIGRLRNAYCFFVVLLIVAMSVSAAVHPRGSFLAATLVFIWVSGLVLVRRGWSAAYVAFLLAASAALSLDARPLLVMALTVVLTGAALFTAVATAQRSTRVPTSWQRAVPAAMIGAAIGVLLVITTGAGWTGSPVLAMLSLLPSLSASMWAGSHLSKLWIVVPAALRNMDIRDRTRSDLNCVAGPILVGALARAVVGTFVLSLGLVAMASRAHHGSDALPGLLVALGGISIVGVVASLLEAFQRHYWAIAVVASGCAAAVLTRHPGPYAQRGAVALLPASVALLVGLWPLVSLVGNIDLTLPRAGI